MYSLLNRNVSHVGGIHNMSEDLMQFYFKNLSLKTCSFSHATFIQFLLFLSHFVLG